MKKFTKGALITAGCFLAGGVILGTVGAVGKAYTGERLGNGEEISVMRDVWSKMRGWDLRWRRGGASRGLTLEYGGVEYDDHHDITYGSFTDDSMRGTDIRNLDVEIGGGTLTISQGDGWALKKENGPECQYYVEGDTFYLKQKAPVGGGVAALILTLPEGIRLDDVDITMGAGKIDTKNMLSVRNMEIEVDAGEINLQEVEADSFCAEVAAGSVTVRRLDAKECDVDVNMGSIMLQDGLVTGDLDADVDMGDISIFLRDFYENHDYDVSCSMGEIRIKDGDQTVRQCDGMAGSMEFSGKNSAGNSRYELSCSMGNILMEFSGETAGMDGEKNTDDGNREDSTDIMEDGLPELDDAEILNMEEEFQEKSKIYGIKDNWPKEIGRENRNTTAENFSFEIQIEEPIVLVVSCVTESGELDLEIENEKEKEIFEKDHIRTGDYEVAVDRAGTYRVCFDCEDHTGSLWIRPKE